MRVTVLPYLPGIAMPSSPVGLVWLAGVAENGPYLPSGGNEM